MFWAHDMRRKEILGVFVCVIIAMPARAMQEFLKQAKDRDATFLQMSRDKLEPVVKGLLEEDPTQQQQGGSSLMTADQMLGLQALQQIQLPRDASLLPQQLMQKLPDRCAALILVPPILRCVFPILPHC